MLEVCQHTVNSSFCSGTSWKPMVSTHKMDLHWASFWRRKAMDERTWFCKVPNRHADSGNQTHSPSHGFCYADLVLYRKPMVWQRPCGHTCSHCSCRWPTCSQFLPVFVMVFVMVLSPFISTLCFFQVHFGTHNRNPLLCQRLAGRLILRPSLSPPHEQASKTPIHGNGEPSSSIDNHLPYSVINIAIRNPNKKWRF